MPSTFLLKALATAEANPVLDDGPVVYLRLDEPTPTEASSAVDSSGNSHIATYHGGMASVAPLAPSGSAVSFDGSNDYVHIQGHPTFNAANITVEALIKTAATGFRSIWDRDETSAPGRVFQFRLNAGYLEFVLIGTSVVTVTDTTAPINDDVAHHVAVTYDGANVRLYVDGVQVKVTATTVALPQPGTANLRLGMNYSVPAGAQWFIGTMDEAAYYTTALSAAQIAAHAAAAGV